MKPRHAVLPIALLLALPLLAMPSLAWAERGFQVRDLATLDRVSSPTLSPDGRKLVFAKRVVDFDANTSSTSLWIEDLVARDAAPPVRSPPARRMSPAAKSGSTRSARRKRPAWCSTACSSVTGTHGTTDA